ASVGAKAKGGPQALVKARQGIIRTLWGMGINSEKCPSAGKRGSRLSSAVLSLTFAKLSLAN
ncbi:MAG TPA: hypothetical protein VGT08_18235, partial [Terracidiphilus sp.]|nr:hypothetical protein [Terracidiphilus sp.]